MAWIRISSAGLVLISSFVAGCSGSRYSDFSRELGESCEEDTDCMTLVCRSGECVEDESGDGSGGDAGTSGGGGGTTGGRTDAGTSSSGACAYYDRNLNRIVCEQRSGAGGCPGKFLGSGTTCVGLECPSNSDPSGCTVGGAPSAPTKGQVVVWTDEPLGWKPLNWKGSGDATYTVMSIGITSSHDGTIPAGKYTSAPGCGAKFAVTKTLDPGSYSVRGKVYFINDVYGNSYAPYTTSASFKVTAGTCTQVVLR
jgi:hypothetical protein